MKRIINFQERAATQHRRFHKGFIIENWKDISKLKYATCDIPSFLSLSLENLRASTKETEAKAILKKNYKSSFHETRWITLIKIWTKFMFTFLEFEYASILAEWQKWQLKNRWSFQRIFRIDEFYLQKKKNRPATYVRPNYYSIDRVTFEATIIFPLNYFDYKFWSTTNKRIICISWKISEDAIAELKTKVEDL